MTHKDLFPLWLGPPLSHGAGGVPQLSIPTLFRGYSYSECYLLLEAHRQTVVKQIEELQATLQLIDYKIQNYTDIEQKQEKVLA